MRVAFFDTETSGLPNKRAKSLDLQPHIMQLAVSLYDSSRRPVFELSTLVRLPPLTPLAEEAQKTHGISPELTAEFGVAPHQALALLRFALERADLVVAHNLQFDEKLVGYMAERLNFSSPIVDKRTFCTMEACTPLLKLPPTESMIKWGHGDKFKNPKLSEAYKFFFNEDIENAHDALVDTRACARIYFHLREEGLA